MPADINISVGTDQNSVTNMRKFIERNLNNLSFGLSQRSLITAQKDIAEKVRPSIKFVPDQQSLNQLTRLVSRGMGQIKLGFTVTQEQRKSLRDLIQRETKNIAVDFNNSDIRKLADALKGISKVNLNITNAEFKEFEDKVRSHFEKSPLVIKAQIRPIGYEQLRKDVNGQGGGGRRNNRIGSGNNNNNNNGPGPVPSGSNGNNQNNYNNQLDQTTKKTKDVTAATEEAGKAVSSFAERVGFTTSRLAAYLIPATAIFQLGNFFSVAGSSVKQINADVNKLTQILDGNAEAASNVADQVFKLAQRYGQSGKDLLGIASTLAQAGDQFSGKKLLDAVEALSRTKLAATFGEIQDTTEGAIAALNQFQLQGDQLNEVLDVTNQLAKKFAFESGNLFEAVRTGGASFSVAGGNIKEFAAAVTAVRQLTRLSSTTIGVGLNTISQRSLRPELVRFQEELTRNVGGIRDADGSLLGLVDRWKQVAKATKDYTDEELQPVIEKLSDIRQGKILLPLLRDLQRGGDSSVFLKALEESQHAAGSLLRDTQIGLNRIDVQLASVGAKFEEVFKNLAQNRSLQELVKDFATLAKTAADALNAIGPLAPILLKLGGIKLAFGLAKGIAPFYAGLTTPQDKRGIPGSGGGSLSEITSSIGLNFGRGNKLFPNEVSQIGKNFKKLNPVQQALIDIGLHESAIRNGTFDKAGTDFLSKDIELKRAFIDVVSGKGGQNPDKIQSIIGGLREDQNLHRNYLKKAEDYKTGSHAWHKNWIKTYDSWIKELEKSAAPPAPPPLFPGSLGDYNLENRRSLGRIDDPDAFAMEALFSGQIPVSRFEGYTGAVGGGPQVNKYRGLYYFADPNSQYNLPIKRPLIANNKLHALLKLGVSKNFIFNKGNFDFEYDGKTADGYSKDDIIRLIKTGKIRSRIHDYADSILGQLALKRNFDSILLKREPNTDYGYAGKGQDFEVVNLAHAILNEKYIQASLGRYGGFDEDDLPPAPPPAGGLQGLAHQIPGAVVHPSLFHNPNIVRGKRQPGVKYVNYRGVSIPVNTGLGESQRLLESGLLDILGEKQAVRSDITALRQRGTNISGTLGLRDDAQAALTKVLFAPKGFSTTDYFGPNEGSDVVKQYYNNALRSNSDLARRARNKLITDRAKELFDQRLRAGDAQKYFPEEYQKALRSAAVRGRGADILKSGKIDPRFLQQIVSKGTEDKALSLLYSVPQAGGLGNNKSQTQVPTGLTIEQALFKAASKRELQRAALLQAEHDTTPLSAEEILKYGSTAAQAQARSSAQQIIYDQSLAQARGQFKNKKLTIGDLTDAASSSDFAQANANVAKREERIKAVLEGRIRQYGRSLESTTGTTDDLRKTQAKLNKAAARATTVFAKLGTEQKDVLNSLDVVKQARFARIEQFSKNLDFIDQNRGLRGFAKRAGTGLKNAAGFGLNHFAEAFSVPVALALQTGANEFAGKINPLADNNGRLVNNFAEIAAANRRNTITSGKLGGASSGALIGAQIGLAAGPIGALIGLVGGALVGSIFGGRSASKDDIQQRRTSFANAASLANNIQDASKPTLELIRSLKTESGSLRSNLKRFDETEAGRIDTQSFKGRLDSRLRELARNNPGVSARDLVTLAGTSLTKEYANNFASLGDTTAASDANKYVLDKLKRLGNAAEESAQQILSETKTRSVLVQKIQNDFGKGASLDAYALRFNRQTRGINNNNAINTAQNQAFESITQILGGGNQSLKLPDQYGTIVGQRIQNQLNANPITSFNINKIIEENIGDLLSDKDKSVFADTISIQKNLERFVEDSLGGLANTIVGDDQVGASDAVRRELDKYFSGNFKAGIKNPEVLNYLNKQLDALGNEIEKNIKGFEQDPEGVIKKFLGQFADGSIQIENITAKLNSINIQLDAEDRKYQRGRLFTGRALQYETQGINQQINRARSLESIGFTSEQILSELDKVIGNTNANKLNLSGTAGNVVALSSGLPTKSAGFTKEDLDNSRKFIEAQDKFNDEITKSTNVMAALRAKFEEVSKVVASINANNRNLSGLSVDQRYEQEANFRALQGYAQSVIPQLGGAGTFNGLLTSKSPEELQKLQRQVSGLAGNEYFQQLLNSGDTFGTRKVGPNLDAAGLVDIYRGLIGSSIADPNGQNFKDLITKAQQQAELFNKSNSIEDQQLYYLQQINEALRKQFGYGIAAYDNGRLPPNQQTPAQAAAAAASPPPPNFSGLNNPKLAQASYDFAQKAEVTEQLLRQLNNLHSSNQNIKALADAIMAFQGAMTSAQKRGDTTVKVEGNFNVTGFENVGQDVTVKAIVSQVMTTFRDQLGSSPSEQELRQKLDLAIRQLNQ